MRLQQLLALGAIVPAALAGCIAPPEEAEEAWRDEMQEEMEDHETDSDGHRDPVTIVIEGNVGGTKDELKEFEVPEGVPELRVVAAYSVGGSADFRLYDPHDELVKDDDTIGGSSRGASDWYVVADPHEGVWTLEIDAIGGGSYRFEITY